MGSHHGQGLRYLAKFQVPSAAAGRQLYTMRSTKLGARALLLPCARILCGEQIRLRTPRDGACSFFPVGRRPTGSQQCRWQREGHDAAQFKSLNIDWARCICDGSKALRSGSSFRMALALSERSWSLALMTSLSLIMRAVEGCGLRHLAMGKRNFAVFDLSKEQLYGRDPEFPLGVFGCFIHVPPCTP